jgi:hypothetical protein
MPVRKHLQKCTKPQCFEIGRLGVLFGRVR